MSREFSTNHQVTSLLALERQEVQLLPCNTPSFNMVSHVHKCKALHSFLKPYTFSPQLMSQPSETMKGDVTPFSLKTNHKL